MRCSGPSATSPTGPRSTPTTPLLPANRRAWASWNYHRLADPPDRATLTYRLRSLQGIDSADELLVTLNRDDAIDPPGYCAAFDYAHPVFDVPAIAAQRRHEELNGAPSDLVRRRLLGLRVPRGRRPERPGGVPAAGRRGPVTGARPRPSPSPMPLAPYRIRSRAKGRPGRGPGTPLRSAIYEGGSIHHRFDPVDHRFTYRIAMSPPGPRRGEHDLRPPSPLERRAAQRGLVPPGRLPGRPVVPLDAAVRDLVEERTGRPARRPDRRCSPSFAPGAGCSTPSPSTTASGRRACTSRPHGGGGDQHPLARAHAYVLAGTGSHLVAKKLHVSPFLPMDLSHRFVIGPPGERLALGVDDLARRPGGVRGLDGARSPVGRSPRPGPGAVAVPADDRRGCPGGSTARRSPSDARACPFYRAPGTARRGRARRRRPATMSRPGGGTPGRRLPPV